MLGSVAADCDTPVRSTTEPSSRVGGAIAAPTALSLIADTFPEGPSRTRAMGV